MINQDLVTVGSDLVAVASPLDDWLERVLVVEDEESYQEALRSGLSREGYQVDIASDGAEALQRFSLQPPDLVLLDLLLPDIPGSEVCRRMVAIAPVPIVIVSALGAEHDIVKGLELGAMDYVTKPYRLRELIARMHAVLRRSPATRHPTSASWPVQQPHRGQVLTTGPVRIDLSSGVVTTRGMPVHLSRREFGLLAVLLSPPGLVRTRGELVELLWANSNLSDTRTLDTHIRRLRVKLEYNPSDPQLLVTVARHRISIRGSRHRRGSPLLRLRTPVPRT